MNASFQPLGESGNASVGVLRVHPDQGSWQERSPYTWACTVKIGGDRAELMGVLKAPNREEQRAIRTYLISAGVSVADYEIKGVQISRDESRANRRTEK